MALFRPGQTGEAGCDGVSEANLWRLVVAVMSWHKGRRPGRLFSWRLSREVLEGIGGGAQVAVVTLSAPVVRHWYNRWGATPAEIAGTMPGDELVPLPKMTSTRAIAINAPPEDVWAWLVQIGQGRGGFYSFDALENLLRCDIHSADRIIPQLQELHTGDLIRLAPAQAPCYRVATVAPPASWCWLARTPRPGPCSPSPPARTSWPRRGSGYSVLLTAAGAHDWWPAALQLPAPSIGAVASGRATGLRHGAADAQRHQSPSRGPPASGHQHLMQGRTGPMERGRRVWFIQEIPLGVYGG